MTSLSQGSDCQRNLESTASTATDGITTERKESVSKYEPRALRMLLQAMEEEWNKREAHVFSQLAESFTRSVQAE